ncbi:MAG: lyase family protein [Nitrososphaerota archaeon]
MTDELLAISPIDGRYSDVVDELRRYFSEYALMMYRLRIELEYLKLLTNVLRPIQEDKISIITDKIFKEFSIDEARRIKQIEKETRHDVEALVRYVKERLSEYGLSDQANLVHLGLTSEDVSNLAYSLILKDFNAEVLLPIIKEFVTELAKVAMNEKNTIMLGRTHGLPALPTTLGKELIVHVYRIMKQYEFLETYLFPGKISGAVGTYAALMEVFGKDTINILEKFIRKLGLEPWIATKQVLPHDVISRYLHSLSLLAGCLIDLCRDLWLLTMMGYVLIKRVGVGSSTMPQKVNPIEIENAEGNLEYSSNLLNFLSNRLLVSRLQRDLSDSTLKRNYGVAMAHLIIGIKNLRSFLMRIEFNRELMKRDLEEHPEILSEAIQIRMRLLGKNLVNELRRLEPLSPDKYLEDVKGIIESTGINPDEIIPKTYHEYIGAASLIVESIYRLCMNKFSRNEKAIS